MITNISKYIEDSQIISIVGPTSSGKSALALQLAEHYIGVQPKAKVHLLSADSRQVYQGLEQLTGADIPTAWNQQQLPKLTHPHYQHPHHSIYLHGVSILSPTSDWSVAHFQQLFLELTQQLIAVDRLIIVGGTGFYHLQVMNPAETISITPNPNLRQELEKLSLSELQDRLQQLNPAKLQVMNHSDRYNPRRLIRAIELTEATLISHSQADQSLKPNQSGLLAINHSWPILYLTIDQNTLASKIIHRVQKRFVSAQKEVSTLLKESSLQNKSVTTATGFSELAQFLDGKINEQECIEQWVRAEVQYAKRQLTWWKKRNQLIEIPFQAG